MHIMTSHGVTSCYVTGVTQLSKQIKYPGQNPLRASPLVMCHFA